MSKFTPSGRKSGNITDAINRTEIRGTPLISSMKPTQSILTTGISDRRPKARTMPSGKATNIETDAKTRVRNNPPHSDVSTTSNPKYPP